ncbi:sensor domain-containing protein [Kitasatospora sp. NPDC002227]|uniref:sensor domain-containing protein n=1 Tax=Kitasatospora sp. NPDC002227 TaxID=3154773 RepID=UPI00332D21E6
MNHPSAPPPLPLWRGTPRAVAPPLGEPAPLPATRPAPGIRPATASPTTASPATASPAAGARPAVPPPGAAPARPPAWAQAPAPLAPPPQPPRWNPPQLGPRRRRPLPVVGVLACALLAGLAWYLYPSGAAPAAGPPVTPAVTPVAAPPPAPTTPPPSSPSPDQAAPALLGLTELRHLLDRTLTLGFVSAVPLPATGSDPCDLVRQPATQTLFPDGWTVFRSSEYRSPQALTVDQSVAVYPDAPAAEAVLQHLTDTVRTCLAAPPARTLAPGLLTWPSESPEDPRLPCHHQARRTGPALLLVTLCGPTAEPAAATALLDRLTTGLNG